MDKFKFGDLIENGWASNRNPNKIIMVISHNKNIRCISRKGHQIYFEKSKDMKLKKVGEVDFSEWSYSLGKIRDITDT